MTTLTVPRLPRFLAVALAVGLSLGVILPLVSAPPPAAADTAPVDPTNPGTPVTVSADALPTTQIDRVAWAQVIVGNTVYVAGNFTTARPAGAAPGVNTVPRNNLLAYNIETGNLISGFAPNLNAQALAITASPDGSRIYVGGDFTAVDGVPYYRIVAISTATGQVISSFRPIMGSQVRALAATNTTVFAGGTFQSVNGEQRRFLAQLNASDGSLTDWVADADDVVYAMTVTVDGSKLIAGGRFEHIEGADHYGLVALNTTDGEVVPWAATAKVRNAGPNAAIVSLRATADRVYGSGYVFGSNEDGNLEGIFSADPDTGEIVWIEDCHGDTVSTWTLGDAVYGVGHPHYCGNIGGFPQTDPWTMHHSIAFSKAATGTITPDPYGYFNWAGNPSPSLLNWFPNWIVGSYTGQGQAAWSVTGNDRYIAAAGEFPYVNGVAQYGLTRFAVTSIAPNKVGPVVNDELVPATASFMSGEARISWTATYDRDNTHLSYSLVRDGNTATPVYQTTQDSTFWLRPTMGFIDRGLTPGSTHTYRLYVTDPWNNSISRLGPPVTVSSTNSGGPYGDSVSADDPDAYWPLDESSGALGFDHVGFTDLSLQSGVSRGASGPVPGATASTFSGNGTGFGATQSAITGPNTFTVESWIRTTTNRGGKIIGFGASNTGNSSSYDRHVYMDNSGRIWFGVYPGGVRTVNSSGTYNNGQWHQIVASLGSNGMRLYVDGVLVGSRTDVTTAQGYNGYWRVGGDNLNSWSSQPTSNYFQGDIGQVAIYPSVLSRSDVIDHWVASGRTSPLPPAPADAYGAAVYNLNPDMFWRLGDSGGSTMLDSGQNQFNGNYAGSVTKGVAGAIAGTGNTAVTFAGGTASGQAQFTNPTTYSLETWFTTTTHVGGKLIGFGNERSALSSNYDRHIYMQDDGTLVFGVWTGQPNTIVTTSAYNDGAWHHVVAIQSSDGMKMYVDGTLVGTNPQTEAQGYTGYWRIGGDNTWGSSSPYFAGTLDEVAVYPIALSAQTISTHYVLGTTGTPPNQPPTASFTSSVDHLSASFDGTASTDADGTISGYAWDFGDGQTGSGSAVSHSYAAAGTYPVTLTVTDNQMATAAVTHDVTVTAAPSVNLLAQDTFTRTVAGGWGAAETGGTWGLTGSAASFAVSGGTGRITVGAGSTRTAALGAVSSSDADIQTTLSFDTVPTGGGGYANVVGRQVGSSFYIANVWVRSTGVVSVVLKQGATILSQATVSGVTYTAGMPLQLRLQVTGTAPTTMRAKVWPAGQPEPSAWLTSSTDSTAALQAAGSLALQTYLSGSATTPVMVSFDNLIATTTAPAPPNEAPVAAFTTSTANLNVSVDASGSTDSDGTITSYAWDFGDGQTGSGVTASHSYTAAGNYMVTLTVTDNQSATNAVTHQVTATSPPAGVIAQDDFNTATANGWGIAGVGGTWTVAGSASAYQVSGGVGQQIVPPGSTKTSVLPSVNSTAVDLQVQFSTTNNATGGGIFVSVIGRDVGTTNYLARVWLTATGVVQLQLMQGSTILQAANITGLAYTPGVVMHVRLQVFGTSPTTIRSRIWTDGQAEPAGWQTSVTDVTVALQQAGSVGLRSYLSATATESPATIRFDELTVGTP
jgi:PKD repeat protein